MKSKQIAILMRFAKTGFVDDINKSLGVCNLAGVYHEVAKYAKDWKHYSGNQVHPVEGDNVEYNKNGKYMGKRGKRRRSLARFIANKLRHEIHMSQWHI